MGAFAAATIATSVMPADATDMQFAFPTTVVAEKVVRQGMYQDYEVDIVQEVDDARSTFKSAKETKKKKGTFHVVLSLNPTHSFCMLPPNLESSIKL